MPAGGGSRDKRPATCGAREIIFSKRQQRAEVAGQWAGDALDWKAGKSRKPVGCKAPVRPQQLGKSEAGTGGFGGLALAWAWLAAEERFCQRHEQRPAAGGGDGGSVNRAIKQQRQDAFLQGGKRAQSDSARKRMGLKRGEDGLRRGRFTGGEVCEALAPPGEADFAQHRLLRFGDDAGLLQIIAMNGDQRRAGGSGRPEDGKPALPVAGFQSICKHLVHRTGLTLAMAGGSTAVAGAGRQVSYGRGGAVRLLWTAVTKRSPVMKALGLVSHSAAGFSAWICASDFFALMPASTRSMTVAIMVR